MFNGDQGRLELEVVESTHRNPGKKGEGAEGVVHGVTALPTEGHKKITLHRLWEQAQDVPFEEGTGGHGESCRRKEGSGLTRNRRRR
jgi:hypothetical protein